MKEIFYNPEKAKQEKKEKELLNLEIDKRVKYLEALNKQKNFQKYIIEEIIDEEIKKASNIVIPLQSVLSASPEENQRIMIAQSSRLQAIQDIKNKIANY